LQSAKAAGSEDAERMLEILEKPEAEDGGEPTDSVSGKEVFKQTHPLYVMAWV
jgi:hypothetical protein